jgi:hypothetical protein
MSAMALVEHGTYRRGLATAPRSLQRWAMIARENQTNAFAIVGLKSG